MDLLKFKEEPILGILRGVPEDILDSLMDAIISSGLKTVEFTMNTPGAASLIERAKKKSGARLAIGAGTVLSVDSLKSALDSGATFIVMPVLIEDVASFCRNKNIPFFPGALSPQEIFNAHSAGAAMVKIFPAKFFGPAYFKEIKGPFDKIKLLACGGVTSENMMDYFSCGADAVAFGAGVFKKELIKTGDFKTIEKNIKSFMDCFKKNRRKE